MSDEETFVWPTGWQQALPAIEPLVRGLCRRFGLQDADAEEIDAAVKETYWLQTVRFADTGHPSLPTIAAVRAWAGTTTVRLILKLRKRQGRLAEVGGLDLASFANRDVLDSEVRDVLGAITDKRARDAVRLRLLEGYSLREVGEQLGVGTTMAHKLYHAGVQEARERNANGGH